MAQKHTHKLTQDARDPEVWACRCGYAERRTQDVRLRSFAFDTTHIHEWEEMHTKLRICRTCGERERA